MFSLKTVFYCILVSYISGITFFHVLQFNWFTCQKHVAWKRMLGKSLYLNINLSCKGLREKLLSFFVCGICILLLYLKILDTCSFTIVLARLSFFNFAYCFKLSWSMINLNIDVIIFVSARRSRRALTKHLNCPLISESGAGMVWKTNQRSCTRTVRTNARLQRLRLLLQSRWLLQYRFVHFSSSVLLAQHKRCRVGDFRKRSIDLVHSVLNILCCDVNMFVVFC